MDFVSAAEWHEMKNENVHIGLYLFCRMLKRIKAECEETKCRKVRPNEKNQKENSIWSEKNDSVSGDIAKEGREYVTGKVCEGGGEL